MLIITVSVNVKPEYHTQFLDHMKNLAPIIRAEDGAITFEQSLSIDEDNKVFIYEEWQSEALFKQHLATTHMEEHFVKVMPWIETIALKSFDATETEGLMGQ